MAGPTIANAEVDVTLDGRGLPAQARRLANQAGKVLEPELGDVGERSGRAFVAGMDGQIRQVPANALRAIRDIDTRQVGRDRGRDLADSLSDGILARGRRISNTLAAAVNAGRFERDGNTAGALFARGLGNGLRGSSQRQVIDGLLRRMVSGFGDGGDRVGRALAGRFNNAFRRDVLAGMDRTVALVIRLIATIGPQLVTLTSGLSASLVALLGSAFTGLAGALALLPGPLTAAVIATVSLAKNWRELKDESEALSNAVSDLSTAWGEQSQALARLAVQGIAPLLDSLARAVSGSNFGEALGRSIATIASAFNDVVNSSGFTSFLRALETTFPQALTGFGQAIASITSGLLTLFAAAGPAAVQLGESFATWAANFNRAITTLDGSGALTAFFDQALASLSALMGFLGPLTRALANVFVIGAESGNRLLVVLGDLASRFLAFTQSTAGGNSLREWFAGGEQILNALIPLVGAFGQALADIVTPTTIAQVVSFLGTLSDFIPILFQVLGVIGELNLLNIVANALLGIGQAIEPLLPALADLAAAIGGLDPQVWQTLAVGLAAFVAAGKVVGTLTGPIGSLFTLLRSGATIGAVLRGVVTGLTVAVRALFAALIANPIGLVIAAVAALVAGLVYFFTQTETGRKAWASFVEWLQGLWEGLSEWFTGTFVPALQGAWDAIIAGVQAVGDFFSSAWDAILNAPQALLDWFTGTFVPFLQNLPSLVAASLGNLVGFFLSLPGRIIGALSTLLSWSISFWTNLFVTAVRAVQTGIQNLVRYFTELPSRVQASFTKLQAWWKIFWPALWNNAGQLVGRGVNTVIRAFQNFVTRGVDTINRLRTQLPQILSAAWDRAVSAIQSGIARAIQQAANFVSRFIGYIRGLGSKFYSAMLNSVGEGNRAAVVGIARLLSTVGRIPGQVIRALGGLGSTLYSAGSNLIQGLINGFSAGAGRLLERARNLASQVVSTVQKVLQIHSPSRVFERIGRDTVAGFDKGLDPRGVRDSAAALARTTIGSFQNANPVSTTNYSNARNNNVAAGAIQIITQTTDPEIAAEMVLDRLVSRLG
jgi:phage-related minor tail protein